MLYLLYFFFELLFLNALSFLGSLGSFLFHAARLLRRVMPQFGLDPMTVRMKVVYVESAHQLNL